MPLRPTTNGTFWPIIALAVAASILPGSVRPRCQTCVVVCAEESTKSTSTPESDKQASAARLAVMRSRALSLTAEAQTAADKEPVKVEVIESPLLRYSNPAASIVTDDATVWAWGRTGRPRILASVEKAGCEVVSLSDEPVSLTGKSGLKWSAKATEIKFQPVPKAPVPSDSATARVRQMKDIFARFTATGRYGDTGAIELRPLVRHLYRYANPDGRIVDGAIFALTAGTNPEVFVLLECRKSSKNQPLEWHYGCTRLSAGELEARLDDKIVWTCPAISMWSNTAPYFSTPFGKEDLVSENDLSTAK